MASNAKVSNRKKNKKNRAILYLRELYTSLYCLNFGEQDNLLFAFFIKKIFLMKNQILVDQ